MIMFGINHACQPSSLHQQAELLHPTPQRQPARHPIAAAVHVPAQPAHTPAARWPPSSAPGPPPVPRSPAPHRVKPEHAAAASGSRRPSSRRSNSRSATTLITAIAANSRCAVSNCKASAFSPVLSPLWNSSIRYRHGVVHRHTHRVVQRRDRLVGVQVPLQRLDPLRWSGLPDPHEEAVHRLGLPRRPRRAARVPAPAPARS